MPKISKDEILNAMHITQHSVEIHLPLPPTPLKTQQWANEFAHQFNLEQSEFDWGADRFQVVLNTQQHEPHLQCILCIEWLCEAMWLEPIGAQQSPQVLADYFRQ
jgi:hypothetical protein